MNKIFNFLHKLFHKKGHAYYDYCINFSNEQFLNFQKQYSDVFEFEKIDEGRYNIWKQNAEENFYGDYTTYYDHVGFYNANSKKLRYFESIDDYITNLVY